MATKAYKIGKRVAIYVTKWTYRGYDFHVHRPVMEDGKIQRKGWQVSRDGVPVGILWPDNDKKPSAITMAKRSMDTLSDDDLKRLLGENKAHNTQAYYYDEDGNYIGD